MHNKHIILVTLSVFMLLILGACTPEPETITNTVTQPAVTVTTTVTPTAVTVTTTVSKTVTVSPTTTPTTPTTTTPTTPTTTPTTTPSGTVELLGKIDSAGILLEDVEVISDDGIAVLYLAKGTSALDASGKPLDSITVTAGPPQVLSDEYAIYGLAYDFSLHEAIFDPSAQLTISYDRQLMPFDADEYSPIFGYFDEAESTWIWIEVTADFKTCCITAEIDRLGTYVIAFGIVSEPHVC